MITQAQREAARKTSLLLAAVLAEAKANGMSGVPEVVAFVVGTGRDARFTAQYKHEESAGVFRTCMLAGNDGRVKIYSDLGDVLAGAVIVAPSITTLPVSQRFTIAVDNPESLAPAASTSIATVTSLTNKLLSLREAKRVATMNSSIRGLELTGNAALATGTPPQQAKYAEIVLRKAVIDDLISLYTTQDAALVALIVSMGGTPPPA